MEEQIQKNRGSAEVKHIVERLEKIKAKLEEQNIAHEPIVSEFRKVFREGNISLILDSFDDIFSDFDPREYYERALSDDFLFECRKASRDKTDDGIGLELRLLIPIAKHDEDTESKIKKRLKQHFQKYYEREMRGISTTRKQGSLLAVAGAFMILVAVLLRNYHGFFISLLEVLFEPAGWFTIWTGLEKIFINPKEKKPDLDFYKKMVHAHINFVPY